MIINASSIKSIPTKPEVSSCFQRKLVAALFHSTPILDKRRRSHWDTKISYHAERSRRRQWKQNILLNMNVFAEQLLHGCQSDYDPDDHPLNRGPSWFKQEWDGGPRRRRSYHPEGHSRGKRKFHFCEDDFEVETVFRSAFGGERFAFWSFVDEDDFHSRNWSGQRNDCKNFRRRKYQSEDDYDSSESDSSHSTRLDLASERKALGLSATGPLRLEDVKNAYRACALKWHPDRHHGPSKGVAEEKFKHCSAAYQSLCDKLEMA